MSQVDGSVTRLMKQVVAGISTAENRLWERYFDQLARLCHARLSSLPSRGVDGEDVALSVLDTFIRRSQRGEFPNLRDRRELWSLLFAIALRKSSKVRKHESAKKRGSGSVVAENLLVGSDTSEGWSLDLVMGKEPVPELVAAFADTMDQLRAIIPEMQLRFVAQLKLEGYTNDEIAHRANCSVATVERRRTIDQDIARRLVVDGKLPQLLEGVAQLEGPVRMAGNCQLDAEQIHGRRDDGHIGH